MMRWLRLGLALLRRERASGEWRILLLALVIGVGSVSTTGFLGDRLKRAMTEQGAVFLGADLLVTSPRPIQDWPEHALETSRAIELASMVSREDRFQLVTLRAVDAAWPLRGQVRIAQRPFEAGQPGPALPPPGDIYVEASLLPLLDAQVGDRVRIGGMEFRIGGLVADEPGRIGGIFGLAPRVFLGTEALAATQVIQPGSRITYLYQFAGRPEALAAFAETLKPRLDNTQRLTGAREGSQALRGPFANADRYIQLTALISLLLSVAAVAIAARRHALRHYDQAALLRCLGATTGQLRTLYASQWLLLGLLGSLLGVGLGALAQQGLAALLLPEAATHLPDLGWAPVGAGILSGLLALAGASLPYLLRLSQTPPLRVLRRDLPPLPLAAWISAAITGAALTGLVVWYAQDTQLVAVFLGALAGLILVLATLARLALMAGRWVQRLSAGPVRFGLAQLLRHRLDSTLQLGAFTLALFLIALLTLVRTDLVNGWRQQLPADAPNHFLVNIAPHQQQEVSAYLAQYPIKSSDLYPMIRGKLVSRNGQPITEGLSAEAREDNTLRRELNLTWTDRLPANNEILAGTWHGAQTGDQISVEARMADRLGLALGDRLGFQMGDQTVEARITSLRSVQWESLQPNFFVIFAPGPLDDLPASGLAAIHVPPEARDALTGFVKAFPGITVLALDKLMNDIQAVFDQIIAALQLLLGFLLAAGMAVVLATLLASLDARQQEAVLLRTLGAPRAFLAKSLWSEFLALGALAGLLASACAEIAMALIAQRLFELSPQWHPMMWISLPLAGALLVATGGWLTTRHITRIPPMQSIRAL